MPTWSRDLWYISSIQWEVLELCCRSEPGRGPIEDLEPLVVTVSSWIGIW